MKRVWFATVSAGSPRSPALPAPVGPDAFGSRCPRPVSRTLPSLLRAPRSRSSPRPLCGTPRSPPRASPRAPSSPAPGRRRSRPVPCACDSGRSRWACLCVLCPAPPPPSRLLPCGSCRLGGSSSLVDPRPPRGVVFPSPSLCRFLGLAKPVAGGAWTLGLAKPFVRPPPPAWASPASPSCGCPCCRPFPCASPSPWDLP